MPNSTANRRSSQGRCRSSRRVRRMLCVAVATPIVVLLGASVVSARPISDGGLAMGPAIGGAAAGGEVASTHGSLLVQTTGLPGGQAPLVVLRGRGVSRRITKTSLSLRGLRPGRYVLSVSKVVIGRGVRGVRAGATAYPAHGRLVVVVRAGKTTRVVASYAGVLNPGVRGLPGAVLTIVGEPRNPSEALFAGGTRPPTIGTILIAGPTATLPDGVVDRVTATRRTAGRLVVTLVAVPVTDAVPELNVSESLTLSPPASEAQRVGSRSAVAAVREPSARSAATCTPPPLLSFDPKIGKVEVRPGPIITPWPPQMHLTLAYR